MIDTVIFDFDGTLIDTNRVILDAWQHTYRKFLGHEMPVEHIVRRFGEPLLFSMENEFPGIPPEESAEVYRIRQQEMAAEMVCLFPGVTEMLAEVRAMGFKMGIVTSRTRDSLCSYMERFGIADCFDGVVSCEDTEKHKPDPEPVLLGLERLGSSAENSIMIGDSAYDMLCAQNAGVKTVLVGWRVANNEEKLRLCRVDFQIGSPEELPGLLEEVRKC